GAEAEPDDGDRGGPAPGPQLRDRRADVVAPRGEPPGLALVAQRVAGAVEVEAEDGEAAAPEALGQVAERAVGPHRVVADGVAEEDGSAPRCPGGGGEPAEDGAGAGGGPEEEGRAPRRGCVPRRSRSVDHVSRRRARRA